MEALALDDGFEEELESELQMVREAVLLVASGWASRVVVANVLHGRVILGPARDVANGSGLSVETIATSDPRRVDLAIQP
jgi:hypothetical protein